MGIFQFTLLLQRMVRLETFNDIHDILFHRFPFVVGFEDGVWASQG